MRGIIHEGLGAIGVTRDAEANDQTFGKPGIISGPDSKIQALVMPTNEELMIARQTISVLSK